MTLETAIRLNGAATLIAMHIDAIPGATDEHLRVVRSATLAQLQTAAEVVEAHNELSPPDAAGIRKCYVIAAPHLLERAKAWADRQPATPENTADAD